MINKIENNESAISIREKINSLIEIENNPEQMANAMCGSYLTFVSGRTGDELDAAFGKGNENLFKNMGMALAMYARFKGEANDFYALPNCNTLFEINQNPEAIDEIAGSNVLTSLFGKSTYANEILNSILNIGNNIIQSAYGKGANLTVEKNGNYKITFVMETRQYLEYTINVNGVALYTAKYGKQTGSSYGYGFKFSSSAYLKQGDIVSLTCYDSYNRVSVDLSGTDRIIYLSVANELTEINDISLVAGNYLYNNILSGTTIYTDSSDGDKASAKYTFTKSGKYRLIGFAYSYSTSIESQEVKIYSSDGTLKETIAPGSIFKKFFTYDIEINKNDYIQILLKGNGNLKNCSSAIDMFIAFNTKREVK